MLQHHVTGWHVVGADWFGSSLAGARPVVVALNKSITCFPVSPSPSLVSISPSRRAKGTVDTPSGACFLSAELWAPWLHSRYSRYSRLQASWACAVAATLFKTWDGCGHTSFPTVLSLLDVYMLILLAWRQVAKIEVASAGNVQRGSCWLEWIWKARRVPVCILHHSWFVDDWSWLWLRPHQCHGDIFDIKTRLCHYFALSRARLHHCQRLKGLIKLHVAHHGSASQIFIRTHNPHLDVRWIQQLFISLHRSDPQIEASRKG